MKQHFLIAVLMVCIWMVLGATHVEANEHPRATIGFIDRDGHDVGAGVLIDGPHGVLIDLDLHGLPPGRRAIHVHAIGTCDDPDEGFVASGGHLNPEGRKHGLMNPEGPDNGDLPNLIVREDGTVQVELFTQLVSLQGAPGRPAMLDYDGAALVIHAQRDDHYSQPIGGAGPRIACGVIHADE
ncbi:MAG: superoxide dismutase family protein [Gammaproteobacteria bacterium]|nr:MAG: superoxide dismutase family protein [Gammaproteobacteria bacterium]